MTDTNNHPNKPGDSITVANSKHYSGMLLKRYYDARAESSIGIGKIGRASCRERVLRLV